MTTRARLRFIKTIPAPSSDYGSDRYGDGTYGMRATDAAEYGEYQVIPLHASTDEMVWVSRHLDSVPTWACRLVSFGYDDVTQEGVPMPVDAVAEAWVQLDPIDPAQGEPVALALTPVLPDILQRTTPDPAHPVTLPAGAYRVLVVVTFQSGRRMCVPVDDRSMLGVADSVGAGTVTRRW